MKKTSNERMLAAIVDNDKALNFLELKRWVCFALALYIEDREREIKVHLEIEPKRSSSLFIRFKDNSEAEARQRSQKLQPILDRQSAAQQLLDVIEGDMHIATLKNYTEICEADVALKMYFNFTQQYSAWKGVDPLLILPRDPMWLILGQLNIIDLTRAGSVNQRWRRAIADTHQ